VVGESAKWRIILRGSMAADGDNGQIYSIGNRRQPLSQVDSRLLRLNVAAYLGKRNIIWTLMRAASEGPLGEMQAMSTCDRVFGASHFRANR